MSNHNKAWFVKIKPNTSRRQIKKQILTAMKKAGWKFVNEKSGGKNGYHWRYLQFNKTRPAQRY